MHPMIPGYWCFKKPTDRATGAIWHRVISLKRWKSWDFNQKRKNDMLTCSEALLQVFVFGLQTFQMEVGQDLLKMWLQSFLIGWISIFLHQAACE